MTRPPAEFYDLLAELAELCGADPWGSMFVPSPGGRWELRSHTEPTRFFRFEDLPSPAVWHPESRGQLASPEGRARQLEALRRAVASCRRV
ncbi:MAG: hypothetical protein ACOZNI_34725 [Myxococcota bacterium]